MKSQQFDERYIIDGRPASRCPYMLGKHIPISCEDCKYLRPHSIDKKRGVVYCDADTTYKPMQTIKPQSGDVLMVHTESTMGSLIQVFQQITDPQAGYYNHSGLCKQEEHAMYVYEATQLLDHKLKAAVRPTPLSDYTDKVGERYQLMILRPKFNVHTVPAFERTMLSFVGMPYDYVNLVWHQIYRILSGGVWKGRKKEKAWKRLICHEYSMTVYDTYCSIFPKCHQGAVEDLWSSDQFDKYVYFKEPLRDGRWVLLSDAQRLGKEAVNEKA